MLQIPKWRSRTSITCRGQSCGNSGNASSRRNHRASIGRDILALGIAYVRQERRYGGLRKPVARELNRLLSRVLGYIPESGSSRYAITLIRKLRFSYQSFWLMVKLNSFVVRSALLLYNVD
jgi:hypothetical protein